MGLRLGSRERTLPLPGVVVQLVRIPACHAGGRGFESRPLRQTLKRPVSSGPFVFQAASEVSHCSGPFIDHQNARHSRIPAYVRRSRHGIYYFRIVVPRAFRPRWGGARRSNRRSKLMTCAKRVRTRRDAGGCGHWRHQSRSAAAEPLVDAYERHVIQNRCSVAYATPWL